MAAIIAATVSAFLNNGMPLLIKAVTKNRLEEVKSIARELKYIHAFCEEHSRSGAATCKLLEVYLEDMEELAYEIEDFIDCFLSKLVPRERKAAPGSFPGRAWRFVMRTVIPSSIQIDRKILELNEKSTSRAEKFKRYADGKAAQTGIKKEATPPTQVAASHLCMEDAARELLQLVTRKPIESEKKKKLKVISIVGYGALGNTLLVNQVYDTDQVRNHYHVCARVDAADKMLDDVREEIRKQLPQRKNGMITSSKDDNKGTAVMLKEDQEIQSASVNNLKGSAVLKHHKDGSTIKQLPERKNGTITSKKDDNKGRAVMLTEHQDIQSAPFNNHKDGRYLIVIDNVDMDTLDKIIKHSDNILNGERGDDEEKDLCIVATTDYTKAIHCNCSALAPDSNSTAQYLEIGELTNTTDKEESRRLEKKLQDVLVSNYHKSLSSLDLEGCLLYLCMFPHDHLVSMNLLIMRYLAEGIVFSQQKIKGEGKYCSPREFLKILTDHNVVQPVQVSKNGNVKNCQPHVMMLNHISGQSKSKNFFALLCGSTAIHGLDAGRKNPVRRLSLHPIGGENDDRLSLPKDEDLSLLRTLVVFHTGSLALISQVAKYELLRVLDLKRCAVLTNKHVKKICDLLLLKYLGLGEGVDEIPREIAKLEWLQTLVMMKTKIVYVPVEIMELPRLKHLLGKFRLFKDDITPNKLKELLSKNSNLERLSGFVIDKSQEFEQLIGRMLKLRKVKIWCHEENWTDGVSLSTAIEKFSKNNIPSLSLDDDRSKGSLSIDCNVCPSKILESLGHPGALTSLKLRGDLKQFLDPTIQEKPMSGIEELCLSGTKLTGSQILSVVKLFRALTYLKLVEDDLGPLVIPAECLNSLKRLCLVAVGTLRQIIIQPGALVCLQSLHILFGKQEDLSGIQITSLAHLEEIGLHSGVDQVTKEEWQAQASQHDNKPKLVLIQSPEIEKKVSNSSDEQSPAAQTNVP